MYKFLIRLLAVFFLVNLFLFHSMTFAQELDVHPDTLNPDTFLPGSAFTVTGTATSDNAAITQVEYQIDSSAGSWTPCTIGAVADSGDYDSTFAQSTGFGSSTRVSAIQDDGRIVIGGDFTSYQGESHSRIVRVNSDGSIDSTFDSGTGFNTGSSVYDLVIQDDGKIIAVGSFTSYNGTNANGLIRLDSDGSIDSGFYLNSDSVTAIYDVDMFSDGKILIGGSFNTYAGSSSRLLAKLNVDGTLDTSFPVGTGLSGTQSQVRSVDILDDGDVLVGGRFTTYQGATANRFTKINSDGTLDSTFSSTVGTGPFGTYVHDIKHLDDGKILIGGDFTSYNGTTAKGIARINSDGSLDTSFDSSNGVTGGSISVFSIGVLDNDKVIIAGNFTAYEGNSAVNIARINSDGTYDDNFNFDSKFGSTIFNINKADESHFYASGLYTSFDTSGPSYFGRYFYRYSTDVTCSSISANTLGSHTVYLRATDAVPTTINSSYPSVAFSIAANASSVGNTFHEDRKCRAPIPPDLTWLKISPTSSGLYIEWVQYIADKISIHIDDGSGRFPWTVDKTMNDGHELLLNVAPSQAIKITAYNSCKKGSTSQKFFYNIGNQGWFYNN